MELRGNELGFCFTGAEREEMFNRVEWSGHLWPELEASTS